MSKSLGNFFLVRDILQKFPAGVIRFYLLSTHYRSPLDFADDKLEIARKGLERLQTSYRLLLEYLEQGEVVEETNQIDNSEELEKEILAYRNQFLNAMNDDFNTALAIAVLFDFARSINTIVSKVSITSKNKKALASAAQVYTELARVLGLEMEELVEDNSDLVGELMELIIGIRKEARAKKDYQTADNIRDTLKDLGLILEDTPQGVRWRRQ
jgi:cysteinyl-tRNA synthetase